jgi:hypothetical protein
VHRRSLRRCFEILAFNFFVAANKTTPCLKSLPGTLTASLRIILTKTCACLATRNILGGRKDDADVVWIAEVSGALVTLSTSGVGVGVCAVHDSGGRNSLGVKCI